MSQALRWMLILGCLMLAVLEAPRSSALVAEDLAGPYCEPLAARTAALEHRPQTLSAIPERWRAAELALADTETK
jgi:hypothetical protein